MKELCKLKKKSPKKYKDAMFKFSHNATYFCTKCDRMSCEKKALCKAKKL